MATSKVKIQDNINKFLKQHDSAIEETIDRMSKDILRVAKVKVPRKNNTLIRSGQIEKGKNKNEVYVSFGNDGSNADDYAAVQEVGRRAGARAFTNYTSPGTGAHYLRDAGTRITEQSLNYIRQAMSKIRG